MADCPLISKCAFFNDEMKEKPGMTKMYKSKYCRGDNTKCARWLISTTVGKEYVTLSIYPNMVKKADEIITEAKESQVKH
jgi:hypothetical protein